MLHGTRSYLLQDANGQTLRPHSISAGLDYPGVGPEHAWLHDTGRADVPAGHRRRRRWTRFGCCAAPRASSRRSSPRTRWPARFELGRELGPDAIVLVNLSGRGDKDVDTAARWFDLLDARATAG